MIHPLKFRIHVLKIPREENLSHVATAKRLGISQSSVVRWLKKVEPAINRDKPAIKIDMQELANDVERYPDAYQHERAERLGVSPGGR